jgi:D-alanyl-lipoteichoic acid acyltransferase DltB (MBOAT superfamily)
MLFNSFSFIYAFLPLALGGFFLLGRLRHEFALSWLFFCSLFFYSWWDWRYLPLLLASILFHYIVGLALIRTQDLNRKYVLYSAIVVDLALLVYFKYTDMFILTWNRIANDTIGYANIILPLGISFFTFTQIAYLVDVSENKVKEFSFLRYGLFVTYFPHLIAGPVLHHNEMMPQFSRNKIFTFKPSWFGLGTAVFCIGLAKKVLLADNISQYSNSVFADGFDGGVFGAWIGVLAYSFQLYFDFSGYSDMAVGLSMMIGVRLPINFFSPYKSRSISEFWRRWHMTLSRFLRDYLYIRLGGNRRGRIRRYLNLIITMFLGGLWHGAGWNFALWGLLHGTYLCIHEIWRVSIGRLLPDSKLYRCFCVSFTFLSVVWAWVPFRASSIDSSIEIWLAMIGAKGILLPEVFFSSFPSLSPVFEEIGIKRMTGGGSEFTFGLIWIIIGALVAFFAPNTYQLFRGYSIALVDSSFLSEIRGRVGASIRLTPVFAVLLGLLFALSMLFVSRPAQFLYFQF